MYTSSESIRNRKYILAKYEMIYKEIDYENMVKTK